MYFCYPCLLYVNYITVTYYIITYIQVYENSHHGDSFSQSCNTARQEKKRTNYTNGKIFQSSSESLNKFPEYNPLLLLRPIKILIITYINMFHGTLHALKYLSLICLIINDMHE